MDRGAGANRSRAPKLACRTGRQKFARIVTKVIRHSNSSIEALRVRLVQPHAWSAREARSPDSVSSSAIIQETGLRSAAAEIGTPSTVRNIPAPRSLLKVTADGAPTTFGTTAS